MFYKHLAFVLTTKPIYSSADQLAAMLSDCAIIEQYRTSVARDVM